MAAGQGTPSASIGCEGLWRTSLLESFHSSGNYGFYLNAGEGGIQVNKGGNYLLIRGGFYMSWSYVKFQPRLELLYCRDSLCGMDEVAL